MKQFFYPLFFALTTFASMATAAEPVEQAAIQESAIEDESVKEISVQDVQKLVQDKAANVAVLDANNSEARKDVGVVPGAILLTSYNQYAVSELPKDKNTTLVFYCYNSYCQASHMAAARALQAGYKDVRVMKAGIVGWNAVNKKAS